MQRVKWLHFNFHDLIVQLTDETDGVLKLQRLGGHDGTDRTLGGIPNLNGFVAVVASLGSVRKHGFEMR